MKWLILDMLIPAGKKSFISAGNYIAGSIEEELFNIKLLSICPPKAYRPYFQEGYLVGSFPSDDTARSVQLDMGRRLIAKFKLKKQRFWSSHFTAIPDEALYPKIDPMKEVCEQIKERVEGPF